MKICEINGVQKLIGKWYNFRTSIFDVIKIINNNADYILELSKHIEKQDKKIKELENRIKELESKGEK